jgi:extradiol dioxygenase family protein
MYQPPQHATSLKHEQGNQQSRLGSYSVVPTQIKMQHLTDGLPVTDWQYLSKQLPLAPIRSDLQRSLPSGL